MPEPVAAPTAGPARRTAPRVRAADGATPWPRLLAWADQGREHVAWAASAALVALSALGLVLVQRIYEQEGHGGSGKLWEHSDSGSERPFWTMIVLLVLVAAMAALVAGGRLRARRSLLGAVGAAVLVAVATVDATVVNAIWTADAIGVRRSYVVALALVTAAGVLTWHAGGAMPVGRAPLRRPVALLPAAAGIAAAAVLFAGGRPMTLWGDTAAGLLVVLGVAASLAAAVRGDDRARTAACVLAAAAVLVLLTFSALGDAWAIAHAGLSLTLVVVWLLVEVAAAVHGRGRVVTTARP
jgi:hypothetical protein